MSSSLILLYIDGPSYFRLIENYPWTHKELAARVAKELGLPVDAPRVIEDGTMKRFMRWHKKNM